MNKRQIAEEELKRALLMMKYDSRKTLTENIGDITEQVSTSTVMGDEDLLGSTNLMRGYFQTAADYSPVGTMFASMFGNNQVNLLVGRRLGVKGAVDALDGYVDEEDLAYLLTLLTSLKGKCYEDSTQTPPVKSPAINRFLELYLEDEGEDFIDDVNSVGTMTLKTGSEKIKSEIVKMVETLKSQNCDAVQPTPEGCPAGQVKDANGKCVKKGGGGGGGGGTYKNCTGTYTQGCKADAIKKVQGCLGLVDDGKFGPKTQKSLVDKGFSNGFTDADVDKICNKVQASPEQPKKENPYKDWTPDEAEGGTTTQGGVEG